MKLSVFLPPIARSAPLSIPAESLRVRSLFRVSAEQMVYRLHREFEIGLTSRGVARETTLILRDARGPPYHDPATLWLHVIAVVRAVGADGDLVGVRALGVASMAEAGLLVDARSRGQ